MYYHEKSNGSYQRIGWGAQKQDNLTLPDNALQSQVLKVHSFRVLLKVPDSTYIKSFGIPTLPPRLSVSEVICDYLSELSKVLYRQFYIERHTMQTIQFYFTVPPSWDAGVKVTFRTAILLSGFLRSRRDSLTFVGEHEACAVYCHQIGLLNIQCREALLVVDCGFMFVDFCAYEVATDEPFSLALLSTFRGACR
jgi:hypothetical protein